MKICVSVRWVTLWVRPPLCVSIQLVTLWLRPPLVCVLACCLLRFAAFFAYDHEFYRFQNNYEIRNSVPLQENVNFKIFYEVLVQAKSNDEKSGVEHLDSFVPFVCWMVE